MAAWIVALALARAAAVAFALGGVCLITAGPASSAEFPTAPKALTTPASPERDNQFEAIGTEDGGFLAAWNRANPATFQTNILLQRFRATGSPIGQPTKLDGPAFLEGLPEFVALGGAKYGVLWKSSGPSLKAAVVNGATGKVGPTVTVLAAGAASFIHDMALLANGKVALVTRSFATGGEDTTLIILDRTMRPVGQPRIVEDDVSGPFGAASYEQTVVANGTGGVAIFRAADSQLKGMKFDATGKPGQTFQINTTPMPTLDFFGFARFNVKAEPLENGGYVVSWNVYDTGSMLNFNIYARVFDKRGLPVGDDFVVNQDLSGNQYTQDILTFPGGFAVAWTDESSLGRTTQVQRVFDLKGAAISDDIVTEYFGADGRGIATPSVDTEHTRLADGSFVKILGANAALYGDGIPAPILGTPKANTLSGGPADALVAGGRGNDLLTSTAGADVIDGGDGKDKIDAGTGGNQIVPGGGDDEITATTGADVFVFRPGGGEDVVTGFGRGDRIDVSAFHYDQHDNVLADARQVGADTVITLKDQTNPSAPPNVVRLINYRRVKLTAEMIIL